MESTIITPDLYKESLAEYYKPPSRAIGNLTLAQFFDLLYYTLNIANPDLIIAPSWPQYLLPYTDDYKKTMDNPTKYFKNTLTYMITREEPGSVGGDKQPFGDRREVTPRLREVIKQQNGVKSDIIYGQWFDTLVQFDLWTLTNFEAENLAVWFKRFMQNYRDFFKHMGLSEILFWWRGVDRAVDSIKNNLHRRTLVYFLRTEEISKESDYNLKEIKIQLENLK